MIDRYIKEKKDCSGCYSCENSCPKKCISMDADEEGFWYPKVDYKQCIQCGKCTKACPILQSTNVENEPSAYACMNKEDKVRNLSSSGGIFSLIGEYALENGGIVFGAGFNQEFSVEHCYIESKMELHKLRGSKYVQSRIGKMYEKAKEFLVQGKLVVFSGTPCQIGGLKSFLSMSYENLFCIDIICHGVPSPLAWKKYLEYQTVYNKSGIQRISFRDKQDGWKKFGTSIQFKDDKIYYRSLYKDIFMKAFLKDICLRPSCYHCNFKSLHRQSDMTLADFWGVANVLPDMDDDKGTSLVFVNSEAGKRMLESIHDKMICKEVNLIEAAKHNPAATESAPVNLQRKKFFYDLQRKPINKLIKKYCTDSFHVRVCRVVKRIV